VLLHALLLAGGLVPLVAMLAALCAAAWIRGGRRAEAPARQDD
jgi:hypothetical protein